MNSDLFKAAFYDSGIPQAIYNLDGIIIEANSAFCTLLKYPDLSGFDGATLVAPEDSTDARLIAQTLEKQSNFLSRKQYIRSDGNQVWANTHFSAVYEGGQLSYILGQVTDLSAQHALEVDLQNRREEIERFASVAAHDLREPIGTIAGYATLIQRRCVGQLSSEGQEWLEEIVLGTKQMAKKIDDLLAFSRAGRDTPRGEFHLGVSIEEAKRSVAKGLRESKAVVEVIGDLPTIRGDRSMIAQVFQNLLSNSIKYRGNETLKITIQARAARGGLWEVTVTDNGLGFHPKFRDKIFGVFQRLYTIEEYPGTGIGLAIVKKIVERHGGSVWADAEPGKGSTFTFTLPANPTP